MDMHPSKGAIVLPGRFSRKPLQRRNWLVAKVFKCAAAFVRSSQWSERAIKFETRGL